MKNLYEDKEKFMNYFGMELGPQYKFYSDLFLKHFKKIH